MSGYETSFQRYLLFGGFLFVFIVAVLASWMRDYIAFEKIEADALRRFKQYKIYKNDKYLPQIKVAGPEGTLVNVLDGEHFIVLNIWATWCAPCIKELPSLKRLNTILSYDKKWRVIAVSIDKPSDLKKVSIFTEKAKVKEIASYHDINKELQKAVNIRGIPMTLILNKKGKIIYEVYGDTIWYESNVVSLLRNINLVRH